MMVTEAAEEAVVVPYLSRMVMPDTLRSHTFPTLEQQALADIAVQAEATGNT